MLTGQLESSAVPQLSGSLLGSTLISLPDSYSQSLVLHNIIYREIADYLGPTDFFHLKASCKNLYLEHPDPLYLKFNPFASNEDELPSILEHEKYRLTVELMQNIDFEDVVFQINEKANDSNHRMDYEKERHWPYPKFIRYCIMHGN